MNEGVERALLALDGARRAGFALMYDERRRADRAEEQWGLWEAEAKRLQALIDAGLYEQGVRHGAYTEAEAHRRRTNLAMAACATALARLQMEHLPMRNRIEYAIRRLSEAVDQEKGTV